LGHNEKHIKSSIVQLTLSKKYKLAEHAFISRPKGMLNKEQVKHSEVLNRMETIQYYNTNLEAAAILRGGIEHKNYK
jgi:hypothetical protein